MRSKMILTLVFFLSIPLTAYCQSHHFDDIRNTLIQALKNQDAEKATSVYAIDGVQLPPDQKEVVGKAAIKEGYTSFFQSISSVNLKLIPAATWVDADFGVERGVYEMEVKTKNGHEARIKARYILVLKKVDKVWRIKYSMLNNKEQQIK